MTAPTTAATTTGVCSGGCGRELSRETAPGAGRFAEIANRIPLLCEQCAARETALLDAQARHRQAQQSRIRRAQWLAASGLPRELRHIDLEDLDPAGCASAIDCARGWARREFRGLLLTGPFGTGKTTIAAGALGLLLADGPGRWVTAPNLMSDLSHDFGSERHAQALSVLSARYPLVLDDLDKVRPTEYAAEKIYEAVDNSVTRGQQLLITTNLKVGQLAAKWPAPVGEAIASRLAGYCTGVEVTGRDRRIGGAR